MSQLVKMLETLAETMQGVNKNIVEMNDWFSHNVQDILISEKELSCGFAACICGEQAIKRNFDVFPTNTLTYNNYAVEIARNISAAADKEGISNLITSSIYDFNAFVRRNDAEISGMFSEKELNCLHHLNTDAPTPQDCADYINICIEKIKQEFNK